MFQATEAINTLETGTSVDEISVHEESMVAESEFDFSESFNFPENSPRISLK